MIKVLLLFVGLVGCSNSSIASTIEDNLKKNMPGTEVKSIKDTHLKGVYEVIVGKNVFYTNEAARYLLFGHLFDIKTGTDLTAISLEDANRVDWSTLPLDKAIVSGPKTGKKIAVFTDPDCPYCQDLEKMLKNNKYFRVYTFLYPITSLHPRAAEKSRVIWCSEDQHQALYDVMTNNKMSENLVDDECDAPLVEISKLADRLGVRGTPTIISESGSRRSGVRSYDELKAWVEQ